MFVENKVLFLKKTIKTKNFWKVIWLLLFCVLQTIYFNINRYNNHGTGIRWTPLLLLAFGNKMENFQRNLIIFVSLTIQLYFPTWTKLIVRQGTLIYEFYFQSFIYYNKSFINCFCRKQIKWVCHTARIVMHVAPCSGLSGLQHVIL